MRERGHDVRERGHDVRERGHVEHLEDAGGHAEHEHSLVDGDDHGVSKSPRSGGHGKSPRRGHGREQRLGLARRLGLALSP